MDLKGKVFATLICIATANKHFQVPEWGKFSCWQYNNVLPLELIFRNLTLSLYFFYSKKEGC